LGLVNCFAASLTCVWLCFSSSGETDSKKPGCACWADISSLYFFNLSSASCRAFGGEIEFRNQSVFLKPEAGDVVIFPSTFIYSHRALPVDSGVKYSMVTMLDYSDKFHRPDFFQETGS
jgi:hypothetical protein